MNQNIRQRLDKEEREELEFLRFMYWGLRERAGLPPSSHWQLEYEYMKKSGKNSPPEVKGLE